MEKPSLPGPQGMPNSSPCSPITNRRNAQHSQLPCVVGATYLGQAISNSLKFADVPAEKRDALIEQSINACLFAKEGVRISAAASVTVTDAKVEIITHAPPPLRLTWLQASTASCGRCQKYPNCFGLIHTTAESVLCETFSTESEAEVSLFRHFLSTVPPVSSLLTSLLKLSFLMQ